MVGGTGTGKTHLAIAIAANVVRSGARGRYFNTIDLATRLEEDDFRDVVRFRILASVNRDGINRRNGVQRQLGGAKRQRAQSSRTSAAIFIPAT